MRWNVAMALTHVGDRDRLCFLRKRLAERGGVFLLLRQPFEQRAIVALQSHFERMLVEQRLLHLPLECHDAAARPGECRVVRNVGERHRATMHAVALRAHSERAAVGECELGVMAAGAGVRLGNREPGFEEEATAERDFRVGHRIVGRNDWRRKTGRQAPGVLRVVAARDRSDAIPPSTTTKMIERKRVVFSSSSRLPARPVRAKQSGARCSSAHRSTARAPRLPAQRCRLHDAR